MASRDREDGWSAGSWFRKFYSLIELVLLRPKINIKKLEPEVDPSAPWAAYTGEIGPTSDLYLF